MKIFWKYIVAMVVSCHEWTKSYSCFTVFKWLGWWILCYMKFVSSKKERKCYFRIYHPKQLERQRDLEQFMGKFMGPAWCRHTVHSYFLRAQSHAAPCIVAGWGMWPSRGSGKEELGYVGKPVVSPYNLWKGAQTSLMILMPTDRYSRNSGPTVLSLPFCL